MAQGFHERYQFYTYLPIGKVPSWFYIKSLGSTSISFTVLPYLNFRIKGLSLCFVYTFKFAQYLRILEIWVSNRTKSMQWGHTPWFVGVPETEGLDMMCLSYWKFESHQLEIGDEVKISIDSRWKDVHVKEIGVHIVYDDDDEEEEEKGSSSQLTVAKQTSPYGISLPGNVSGSYGCGFLSRETASTLYK